ncbi:MAG: trehalose-6-phosphate synthase [Chloroflexi bacterium]|nr:trehalose-6-phosphate synthase [Chloroflexota bacterium]
MTRTLIVSNRLPATISIEHGKPCTRPSAGGVASCLASVHRPSRTRWIGWNGSPMEPGAPHAEAIRSGLDDMGCVPVFLEEAVSKGYYSELSNAALWPLLHSRLDELPLRISGWGSYREANERFADAVADEYEPGDVVWVHDYQLALVPAAVRRRLPGARIGFFFHVPFPPVEILRAFPWWRDLVTGMLGADLVGFHTEEFAENFRAAASLVQGLGPGDSRSPGDVEIAAFPVGVNAREWQQRAGDPKVLEMARSIREEAAGRKLLLAVDRLDYTKGILRRLAAFEELLASGRVRADEVVLFQVAVLSRGDIAAYETVKAQAEELVGRVNSIHGTFNTVPIRCSYGSMEPDQLAAFYQAADVMLVTPLRDGMNLVAKEFVASRADGEGVLVLSEFAGAATQLSDALIVNPYDVEGMARVILRSIEMTAVERRYRMERMREVVQANTAADWADAFLDRLTAPRRARTPAFAL